MTHHALFFFTTLTEHHQFNLLVDFIVKLALEYKLLEGGMWSVLLMSISPNLQQYLTSWDTQSVLLFVRWMYGGLLLSMLMTTAVPIFCMSFLCNRGMYYLGVPWLYLSITLETGISVICVFPLCTTVLTCDYFCRIEIILQKDWFIYPANSIWNKPLSDIVGHVYMNSFLFLPVQGLRSRKPYLKC